MRFTKISTVLTAAALGVAVAAVSIPAPLANAAPLTNLFTYQGRLDSAGIPVNANVDMRFRLFDGAVLVAQAFYDNVSNPRVFVNRGLFKVDINFGLANFTSGNELTLEIAVRNPPGVGVYTVLTPNQTIRTTPQALFSKEAGSLVLPYTDSAASTDPLVNLSNTTDGQEGLRVATGASVPTEFQNAIVRAVSSTTSVGIYGSADRWGTLGLAQSTTDPLPTGIQGEVAFGANAGAVAGRFLGNGGDVTLGTDGYAADFQNGDALVRGGFLRKAYNATTSDIAIPIAFGYVNSGGTLSAGTPNFTVIWNAVSNWYEVTITGETYSIFDYVTMATPSNVNHVARVDSTGGKLLVRLRNVTTNTDVQGLFGFITFKPTATPLNRQNLRSQDPRVTDLEWFDRLGVPAPVQAPRSNEIPPKEQREDTSVQGAAQRAGK
jgi:hypothetical protein